ncbi:MAG: ATP-binding protein [bacterium]
MAVASIDGSRSGARDSYAASIVDTVRDPLVVLDADLRLLTANRSFYQTFKVDPQGNEGKSLYEIGDRQWDIKELRDLLERILPQDGEVRDYDVDARFPDIGRRTMRLNARRLRQQGNRAPLILLAISDISDSRRAEEARQLFVAATSHDVLNALGNIVGFADMVSKGAGGEELAPRIVSLAKAIGEIMRDLLDHDRAEHERPTLAEVSARGLIRERAEAIEWRCLQKGLGFHVELPPEGQITTDPIKVTRILDNLLSNAVRYTPSGTIHLCGQLAPAKLCVTVKDTGIGIAPEELSRVFDHYYRAPTAQRIEPLGSGLGLSTVKRLCDLLGGTALIDSQRGLGTTCTVMLPRHAPSASPA